MEKEIEEILGRLEQQKDARIRQRKADIAKEYTQAKRVLQEVYREFLPDEIPFDLHRVCRDIDVAQCLETDAEVDMIEGDFRKVSKLLQSATRFSESGSRLGLSKEEEHVVLEVVEREGGATFRDIRRAFGGHLSEYKRRHIRFFLKHVEEEGLIRSSSGKTASKRYHAIRQS